MSWILNTFFLRWLWDIQVWKSGRKLEVCSWSLGCGFSKWKVEVSLLQCKCFIHTDFLQPHFWQTCRCVSAVNITPDWKINHPIAFIWMSLALKHFNTPVIYFFQIIYHLAFAGCSHIYPQGWLWCAIRGTGQDVRCRKYLFYCLAQAWFSQLVVLLLKWKM